MKLSIEFDVKTKYVPHTMRHSNRVKNSISKIVWPVHMSSAFMENCNEINIKLDYFD